MGSHELWWGALTLVAAFVVLAYYTLHLFKTYRAKIKEVEEKTQHIQQQFSVLGDDASVLAEKGKARLSASELEQVLNGFIARIVQKAVVRRRG